jgi:hypothetical protein
MMSPPKPVDQDIQTEDKVVYMCVRCNERKRAPAGAVVDHRRGHPMVRAHEHDSLKKCLFCKVRAVKAATNICVYCFKINEPKEK